MQTGRIDRERFSGADSSFSPALQFILGVVCSDPCQSQIMRGKKNLSILPQQCIEFEC